MITTEHAKWFREHGFVWFDTFQDAKEFQCKLEPLRTEIVGTENNGKTYWRVERVWNPSEQKERRKGKSA